ncbi:GSCFA domain-containing protein [Frigidibacter sp. MR17.14]|uniref:GSCFA domain-containing protein n=1 Tax=Frigidibacter sp. MR17.14 TaxID=3126509 RepID=UPI003012A588
MPEHDDVTETPARHPYLELPEEAFWRAAVSARAPEEITGLWQPKFAIGPEDRIVTAGSCFAQHIGRALAGRGYGWIDAEPAPEGMAPAAKLAHHYGTFSFRTGNIYTANMLAQWLEWALGAQPMPDEVWERDGRVFDPFRPAIEPQGFASRAALQASREATLAAIRAAVAEATVFVFTLGLTESWQERETGVEYAICPGTLAGTFDPARHQFVNHDFDDTLMRLGDAIGLLRRANPGIRVLLTVSPVPLTATASGNHVLVATGWSKAVLRAVAGEIAAEDARVDYFPSYEIITGPPFGGRFYAENLRQVRPEGVAFVMDSFFRDQAAHFGTAA